MAVRVVFLLQLATAHKSGGCYFRQRWLRDQGCSPTVIPRHQSVCAEREIDPRHILIVRSVLSRGTLSCDIDRTRQPRRLFVASFLHTMNVPLHLFTNRLQSRQAQSSYTPISATALESNLHLSTLLDPTNPPAAAAAAAAAVVATPVHASPPSAQVENVTPSKVVHWDSDTDPENPLYFSSAKKSRIVATIAAFTFVT